nr:unnamed protein product [Spirometra erinaceieuropaei]
MINELRAAVLIDLSGDRVRFGRFSAGELLHGPDCFVERRRDVNVDVGLHLRQTGDDGVGYGGGAVADASGAFGSSLRNLSSQLWANTHHRDDEAVVGSPVSTRNRYFRQHFPLVSPPDEDIVQQVTLRRPRMYPGVLPSLWQTEEGVLWDELVFCAGAEKEQTIVIKVVEAMGTDHTSPGSMACAYAGNQGQSTCPPSIQSPGGRAGPFSICLQRRQGWSLESVGADDGDKFASSERQAGAHHTVLDALRPIGQSSCDSVLDDEDDIRHTV